MDNSGGHTITRTDLVAQSGMEAVHEKISKKYQLNKGEEQIEMPFMIGQISRMAGIIL
jgi:hypothetical protein